MKQITRFWNWFQKNEQEIINAFFLGIGSDEVFPLFEKKLSILFLIKIRTREVRLWTLVPVVTTYVAQ